MNKIYVVTAVDCGDSCDGKARVLGTFKNKDEAYEFVKSDIQQWVDDRAGEGVECDFVKMSAHYDYDSGDGCEWNIEETELQIITPEKISKTEQVLIDNGIEADEVETVLQAIGYTLIDTELYPED